MHMINQFIRVEEDGGRTTLVQTVAQPKVVTPKPSARSGNTAKNPVRPLEFCGSLFLGVPDGLQGADL
jgi:hypothetical protein